MRSEISMLRQYGPNVPEETLSRLVKAFSELRTMADEGQIQVCLPKIILKHLFKVIRYYTPNL